VKKSSCAARCTACSASERARFDLCGEPAGNHFLLRRHDYHVDVAGGFAAAQYVSEYVETQGFHFPTRRRAYLRAEDSQPLSERLMVSIELRCAGGCGEKTRATKKP
jgi:hypothetical protein